MRGIKADKCERCSKTSREAFYSRMDELRSTSNLVGNNFRDTIMSTGGQHA